ncbi:hypothetical protein EB001_09815 [bacterium]|nr:hypothetical protein [bacterium]
MFNHRNLSTDTQIQFDPEEDRCFLADISLSHLENNKLLVQLNNNYPNQDLKMELCNCVVKSDTRQDYQDDDLNGDPIPNSFTIHRDIVFVMNRKDGHIKISCPTFKGLDQIISWVYKNESWIVKDFENNIYEIVYKD